MVYLQSFQFPGEDREDDFILAQKRTCYDSYYPFRVFTKHEFDRIDFAPVTMLYGSNGSGKTTALNVIADKIGAERSSIYNRSSFQKDFLRLCSFEYQETPPKQIEIITSDDVFDYMLNLRNLNEGIDSKRRDVFDEYVELKHKKFKFQSMDDYDTLVKVNQARSKSQSQYTRENLVNNIREESNGESAFRYFIQKIEKPGIYILDEPENSLSPEKQLELVKYIEDSARFYDAQFIISTHSPFILAMRYARIYDMDHDPVEIRKWTELENMRTYYKLFKSHEEEFED